MKPTRGWQQFIFLNFSSIKFSLSHQLRTSISVTFRRYLKNLFMLPFSHAFYPLGETMACTEGLRYRTDPRSYAGSTMQSSVGLSKSVNSVKHQFPYQRKNIIKILTQTVTKCPTQYLPYKVLNKQQMIKLFFQDGMY